MTATCLLAACGCNLHRALANLPTADYAPGSPTSWRSHGTKTTTDDALLEAAALFTDWDDAQRADLTGATYAEWLNEWDARMDNLRGMIKAARKRGVIGPAQ